MIGILLAFCAAVSWATGAILVRIGLQHLRSTTGTVISLISGLIMVMTLAVIFHWESITRLPSEMFLWFFLSGLLTFPLGRFLNYSAVQRIGVGRAMPIMGIAPLFATLYAIVLLGEVVTVPLILGTIAITGGITMIVSSR